MRFTNIVIASFLAVAAYAQDEESGLTDEVKQCLAKCDLEDVTCRAHCTPVPSPTEDDINKLHDCSDDCDQGDGSEAATQAYATCLDECVLKFYYDPEVGTPGQGQSGGSSSGSGSGSDNGDSSDSADGEDSADDESGDASGDDADSDGDSEEDSDGDSDGEEGAATGLVASSSLSIAGLVAAALLL